MCSNFQPIKNHHANWLKDQFDCEPPQEPWREETYPTYAAPFVYLVDGMSKCELAQFGLVPHWATDKQKFGLRTYNARSETVAEKPSYRHAWTQRHFGIVLMESFYEPCWETGKAVRWRIKRADDAPMAAACIWERFIDTETGEILFSFSMLTVNADGHDIMLHFHRPADEKRSIVILDDANYLNWLHADTKQAQTLLTLAPIGFLASEPAPR